MSRRLLRIKSETEGMDGFAKELLEEETVHATNAVYRAATHLSNKMRDNVSGQGTGRYYQVRGIGLHRASEPGDFPAKLRGQLARAMKWTDVERRDKGRNIELTSLVGPVGSKARDTLRVNATARILERGGLVVSNLPHHKGKKVRVLARPFIEPTVQQERARVERLLEG